MVLTVTSGLVGLSEKLASKEPSQQWTLDYNSKIY